MTAEVIQLRPKYTMNVDSGDGFLCLVCGKWTIFGEVEWAGRIGEASGHGRESFSFCPACGAEVLSIDEWADVFPQDQGKTTSEIRHRLGVAI